LKSVKITHTIELNIKATLLGTHTKYRNALINLKLMSTDKIKNLYKKLDKTLSWPIPYWLTPIGVLLLVGYWYGFSWKVSTENWPVWLWLVDKGIAVGSIILAALWAQHIFNENALRRENRERRLESVIKVLEQLSELGDKLTRFYNSKTEDINPVYQDAFTQLVHISIFTKIYYPELTEDIYQCHKKLTNSKNHLTKYLTAFKKQLSSEYKNDAESGFCGDDPYTYEDLYMWRKEDNSEILGSDLMITHDLENIMHKCIKIHKDIEAGTISS